MRLFIALELDNEIKKKINQINVDLKNKGVKGNFTRKENLHITLAFIGECDNKQMKDIISSLRELNDEPFDIEFSNFNFFGDILYLDIKNNKNFADLAKNVRAKLDEININYDRKPAKAHVTLIRKTNIPSEMNIKEYGNNISFVANNVCSVVLYESTRINGVLQYVKKYEKRLIKNG